MVSSCVPPHSKCVPRPGVGLKTPPNGPFSQPKTTTSHARKSNEFAKRCTPLLKNGALAWEWTSLLSSILLRSIKMHRRVTNTSIGHTHSTNKHWTVNVSDTIPSGFPNRDLVVVGGTSCAVKERAVSVDWRTTQPAGNTRPGKVMSCTASTTRGYRAKEHTKTKPFVF